MCGFSTLVYVRTSDICMQYDDVMIIFEIVDGQVFMFLD